MSRGTTCTMLENSQFLCEKGKFTLFTEVFEIQSTSGLETTHFQWCNEDNVFLALARVKVIFYFCNLTATSLFSIYSTLEKWFKHPRVLIQKEACTKISLSNFFIVTSRSLHEIEHFKLVAQLPQ